MTGDRFVGRNGWFPLFIEWEIEYYHTSFENWTCAPQGLQAWIGYALEPSANIATADIQGDYRVLKGHCLILPSTGATPEATLKQVSSQLNPEA